MSENQLVKLIEIHSFFSQRKDTKSIDSSLFRQQYIWQYTSVSQCHGEKTSQMLLENTTYMRHGFILIWTTSSKRDFIQVACGRIFIEIKYGLVLGMKQLSRCLHHVWRSQYWLFRFQVKEKLQVQPLQSLRDKTNICKQQSISTSLYSVSSKEQLIVESDNIVRTFRQNDWKTFNFVIIVDFLSTPVWYNDTVRISQA